MRPICKTRWLDVLLAALILTLTFAVYWPIRNHAFLTYDDGVYAWQNSHAQQGLNWEGIKWAFRRTGYAANWHPLTWLSHMLDYELYGSNAGRHHLTNLGLHLLSALLLYIVFRQMTRAVWPSAFVAMVFALHPLHVESVAWIAERKDVLSAVFWMAAMWAYYHYTQRPGAVRYLPVLLLFALGLMSKPMVVTLPFVLLLLDFWPLARHSAPVSAGRRKQASPARPGLTRLVLEKVPLLLMAAVSSVITFQVQQAGGAVSPLSFSTRLSNAVLSYGRYLGDSFWPGNLAIFYPHPGRPAPETLVLCLLCGVLLGAVTAIGLWQARHRPWLLTGWLWYLGTLIPVIGLVQVGSQARADRYMYIPLIGVSIITAWGLAELAGRWRLPRWSGAALLIAVMVPLAWTTSRQVACWKNTFTVFQHALAVTRDNDVAYANLGVAYAEKGDMDQAIMHHREVVRICPTMATAWGNLGKDMEITNHPDKALEYYGKALALKPDHLAHFGLANALRALGRTNEALEHYRRALELKSDYAQAHGNLAALLTLTRDYNQAIEHYEMALRLDPAFADAHSNYAATLEVLGKRQEALFHYREALRVNPAHPAASQGFQRLTAQESQNGRPPVSF
jgi:protein O-mannosyl-transferase